MEKYGAGPKPNCKIESSAVSSFAPKHLTLLIILCTRDMFPWRLVYTHTYFFFVKGFSTIVDTLFWCMCKNCIIWPPISWSPLFFFIISVLFRNWTFLGSGSSISPDYLQNTTIFLIFPVANEDTTGPLVNWCSIILCQVKHHFSVLNKSFASRDDIYFAGTFWKSPLYIEK